jgi:hypothetical protein
MTMIPICTPHTLCTCGQPFGVHPVFVSPATCPLFWPASSNEPRPEPTPDELAELGELKNIPIAVGAQLDAIRQVLRELAGPVDLGAAIIDSIGPDGPGAVAEEELDRQAWIADTESKLAVLIGTLAAAFSSRPGLDVQPGTQAAISCDVISMSGPTGPARKAIRLVIPAGDKSVAIALPVSVGLTLGKTIVRLCEQAARPSGLILPGD